MEDIKKNISQNLIMLRKSKKITQQDLAKEMNYSDKAVSRWELGDSLPDISILLKLCEFYGVDFDWLIHEHNEVDTFRRKDKASLKIFIAILFSVCVYAMATVIYVYGLLVRSESLWLIFIYACPLSLLGAIWCSKKWWRGSLTFSFISAELWTIILCFFLRNLSERIMWPIFLVGIPFQIILVLLYLIKK